MRWVLIGLLVCAAPVLAEERYIDDRSGPEEILTSLYNAINAGDFARAWSYFAPYEAPSFSAYIRGFEETEHVRLQTGQPERDGARWHVPVVLEARQTDGSTSIFTGCYTVLDAVPRTRPPYQPIAIQSGHFHAFDGPLEEAQGDCHWD